jgi:hypothetical protein
VEVMLENGFGLFLDKKVQETNVEKSKYGLKTLALSLFDREGFCFEVCEIILLF